MATDEDAYNDMNHQQEALTWRAETRDLVKERNEDIAFERKDRHDRKLQGVPRQFVDVGDLIMVLDKTEGKTKFDPRWRGPFQVIEKCYTAYRLVPRERSSGPSETCTALWSYAPASSVIRFVLPASLTELWIYLAMENFRRKVV
jgi:hypothetical protein